MLYIFDPDAMHNVIVKDQYIYEEAAFFIKCVQLYLRYTMRDLTVPRSNLLHFGPGLLGTLGKSYGIPNTRLPKLISASGDHHRKQRKLLNPVFSIAHMRRMIPIFTNIGHKVGLLLHILQSDTHRRSLRISAD